MLVKIENELEKRDQSKRDFYFSSIGMIIKKKRIEKNMTQENVAKGICSNTYLSKFENNNATMNHEYLDSIMERIDLGYESIMLPEEMMDLFKRGFTCFVNDDIEEYDELMTTMKDIEFAVLVELTRLGHHIIHNKGEIAQKIINNLYHYLHSFDNEALAVFIIFQGATHILLNHYKEAIDTLSMLERMDGANEEVWQMYYYLRMIAYGRLCMFGNSSKAANEAKFYFINGKNYRRLALMDLYQIEFDFYENDRANMPINKQFLSMLLPQEKDHFYLLMAISRHDTMYYLDKITPDSQYYGLAVFYKCLYSLSSPKSQSYENAKKELARLNTDAKSTLIPYHLLLSYIENQDWQELNDYIFHVIYPYVHSHQMVYFLSLISREVGSFQASQKKYKDAYMELVERDDDIKNLQNRKKTTELRAFLSFGDMY